MQVGDKVTITGTITTVHGTPETHAPELCSVSVQIPGGQTLWVNQSNVELVAAPAPEPVEEVKPKRGRHERKVVEVVETPEDSHESRVTSPESDTDTETGPARLVTDPGLA